MASEGPAGRRVAALSRHLAAAPGPAGGLDVHSTSAAAPSPEELYRFLVRDNLEMRRAIFDFLQVRPPGFGARCRRRQGKAPALSSAPV